MNVRDDFPTLKSDATFLDSAASSLTPEPVIKAIESFYRETRSSVHRGLYKESEVATEAYESARARVASFIGADSDEIVFTSGATHALNIVASRLGEKLVEGDEVLVTEMEHHANIVPWQEVAKRYGFTLKWVPVKDDLTLDMDACRALLTEKTRVIAITHVSNVTGTMNPIREITDVAHQVGAKVVVDAAQSAPHMKLDVRTLDCDFLAFSGHKMLGPTGVGVLYGKRSCLAEMEPFFYGGHMIRKVSKNVSTWSDAPEKFEAGSGNVAGVIGLGEAVAYLEALGMDAVETRARNLATEAIKRLSAIDGVSVLVPASGSLGIVSFVVDGVHPHDVAEMLASDGVAVRAGHHCAMPFMERLGVDGTTRASFHVYNDASDIDRLVASVARAKAFFSKRT